MNEHLEVPAGAQTKLGPDHLKNLGAYDLLVRTAVMKPKDIAAANPETPDILDKVTTNINEFMRVCPTKNIIGITGTKGKGTTSTLIAKILEADGKKVHLGGNIGIAPLEILKGDVQPTDWVVLEEGAFQLIDQRYSPHIAICVMITSEHMDWYEGDYEAYINSKKHLFTYQKPEDIAIYLAGDDKSELIAADGQAKKIPYFTQPGAFVQDSIIKIADQTICSTDELKLLGRHNWQNVCAATTAVWQVTQNIEAIRSILTSFTGLEHRLELVREVNGVKYYDDSFGTTPETAIVAIQAFTEPKVIILGGSDKGSDYGELARIIATTNVKCAVLIGDMAPKIMKALEAAEFHNIAYGGSLMTEIINEARKQAQPGDVVLLSTACASFGLFRDYKDRGDQFKQVVQSLA